MNKKNSVKRSLRTGSIFIRFYILFLFEWAAMGLLNVRIAIRRSAEESGPGAS